VAAKAQYHSPSSTGQQAAPPSIIHKAAQDVILCLLAGHAEQVCKQAGCPFKGILEPLQRGDIARALILFDDACGSTLGLTLAEFDLHAVRTKLTKAAQRWATAAARVREAKPCESDMERDLRG
jgi:hypothetical protein